MMTPKEATEGLLKAAQEGNTAQIKLYLSEGADVHARSKIANKTALHLVMETGDAEAVNALLAAGADMESKDQYGNNALYCAAFFGRKAIAIILLLRGADYRSVSSADHCTPLQIAKNHGHPDIAALMNEEAIARLRQEALEEPLHLSTAVESKQAIITAIKNRQVDALYELLRTETGLVLSYSNRGEEGARDVGDAGIRVIAEAIGRGGLALEKLVFWDVGITDDGAVALCRELSHIPVKHLQFSYNRITDTGAQVLAELLPPELEHLDLGANQITDHGARSIAAALRGHRHLKHIHLGCPKVTSASIPAFIAALEENTSLVELIGNEHFFTKNLQLATLLERNKTKKVTPEAFIHAAEMGIFSILALGISGGLDLNRTINRNGWSALHQAASYNQAELIRILVTSLKADIEIQNITQNLGWRPLHNAAWNGSKEAISILLELGADPQAKTIGPRQYANKTPAELAMSANHPDISAFIANELKRIQAKQSDPSKKVELMQDEKSEIGDKFPVIESTSFSLPKSRPDINLNQLVHFGPIIASEDGRVIVEASLKGEKGHWHITGLINDEKKDYFMLLHPKYRRPIDLNPQESGKYILDVHKGDKVLITAGANKGDVLEEQLTFSASFYPNVILDDAFEEPVEESVHVTASEVGIRGLRYQTVPGDGHCLFHAVGLYLGEDAPFLRRIVAAHMKENREAFRPYREGTDEEFTAYIEDIRAGREWGDHIEIEIIQRVTHRPIIVLQPNNNPIIPDNIDTYGDDVAPIFLYRKGPHYDALLVEEGFEGREILREIQDRLTAGKMVHYTVDSELTQFSEHSRKSTPVAPTPTAPDSSAQTGTDLGGGKVEGAAAAPPLESTEIHSASELQAVDQLIESVISGALEGLPSSADHGAVDGTHMGGQLASDKAQLLRAVLKDCILVSHIYSDGSTLTAAQENQLVYGLSEILGRHLSYQPRTRFFAQEPDHVHVDIKKGKILGHKELRKELRDKIREVREAAKSEKAAVRP